jgi:SAM-dependent MidA family methyltransferase
MNLQDIISKTIKDNNKPIGFDVFMNLALYHSEFGYYRSNKTLFGRHGDFITAPETSDLFGYTLAKQCKQVLNNGDILEFGAGSGVLAAQILFELGRLSSLPGKYYIIELSGQLRERQMKTIKQVLPEVFNRVEWLTELPKNFKGVVIANEVLDAIPAKRIMFSEGCFVELGVDFQNENFQWKKFTEPYLSSVASIPDVEEEGYTTETNVQSSAWINSLYELISEGTVLLIDYGMDKSEYFHPQRNDGTLKCFFNHKSSDDPFCNIGNQDITTSVNFSDIADSAVGAGFEISGYCTQAMFLISLGIENYLLDEEDNENRMKLAQEIKQLVLPGAMGEVFKVLALSKAQTVKLDGFKEQDLTNKL